MNKDSGFPADEFLACTGGRVFFQWECAKKISGLCVFINNLVPQRVL